MAVKTCATTSQHLIIPRSCKSTWSTHDRTETATAIRDSIFNSFLVLWILIKIFSGLISDVLILSTSPTTHNVESRHSPTERCPWAYHSPTALCHQPMLCARLFTWPEPIQRKYPRLSCLHLHPRHQCGRRHSPLYPCIRHSNMGTVRAIIVP